MNNYVIFYTINDLIIGNLLNFTMDGHFLVCKNFINIIDMVSSVMVFENYNDCGIIIVFKEKKVENC